MRKRDVLNLVCEHVGGMVQGHDFRLNRKEQCFIRTISGGNQAVGIPLYDYNPEFIVSLAMTIRLNIVEDIFNLFSGTAPEYHPSGTTAITQLSYFTRGQPSEYKVVTEQDIVKVMETLAPIIREQIIPFLDRHQDVTALEAAVNRTKPSIDGTQLLARAMHAVILARLVGNNDFERLVAHYQNEMRFFVETEQEKFTKLVAYLREQVPS